jgi:D-alanyl-D-alanine carboxypeptidase
MTKFFTAILLSLLFVGNSYAQEFNKAKLDSLFNILEAGNKTMGSFTIAKNGSIIYDRSIGYSSKSKNGVIKNDANTRFQIGSVTKMFTATIIFQLVDEKKLALDTKLADFYPQMPNAKDITISTLLGHKCGLYDFVNDQEDKEYLTSPRTDEITLKAIAEGKPNGPPNVKVEYSNSGYFLLRCIAEKVSKEKYTELVDKRICKKLGLKNTFSPTAANYKNNIATSYDLADSSKAIDDFYFPNVKGVGDIVSTPHELVVFNEALMGGKLISAASLASMKELSGSQFCHGVMKVPFDKHVGYGHGGDTYGTHSIVSTFEDDKITIAFCVNGELYPHNSISIGMLSICFNEPYELPNTKVYANKTEDLDKYLGEYATRAMALKITITKNGTTLIAQATGQGAASLEASAKDEFKMEAAGATFQFDTEKNEMTLLQGGAHIVFTKEK